MRKDLNIAEVLYDIDDLEISDEGRKVLEDELKSEKMKFCLALLSQDTLGGNTQYVIITKNVDGFFYHRFNEESGLVWSHGPFETEDEAVCRAGCTGWVLPVWGLPR